MNSIGVAYPTPHSGGRFPRVPRGFRLCWKASRRDVTHANTVVRRTLHRDAEQDRFVVVWTPPRQRCWIHRDVRFHDWKPGNGVWLHCNYYKSSQVASIWRGVWQKCRVLLISTKDWKQSSNYAGAQRAYIQFLIFLWIQNAWSELILYNIRKRWKILLKRLQTYIHFWTKAEWVSCVGNAGRVSPFPGQHGVTRLQKHAPAEATDGRRWTIALVVNLLGLFLF